MIVDLTMDGSEFLQRLRPSEFEHRCFSSSKRLVGIHGSIVLPVIWLGRARGDQNAPLKAGRLPGCGKGGSMLR
jgi:hypothetical protein